MKHPARDILNRLQALKPELVARYNVREIGLFGSSVRENREEPNDIDLLVDFTEEADLLDLVGLAQFLEDALGRKVDVVPRKALREELRETVLSELVPV